jgi:X-Pro dipeptidyl-peptidase
MRRNWTVAIAVAATIIGGLLQATPAPAAPTYGSQDATYIIPTKYGDIYAEAVHPTLNGKIVTSPTILTYTPYAVLGRNGDAGEWTAEGYTRITADVIGTGNSGGCYDYGGKGEKDTGKAIIDWIAKQKWSDGKVGMLGGSYNGTTQYAAAVEHPKALKTIVPQAAIDRWYDYAYEGGIRYFDNNEDPSDEGVDTPLAFDFGLAIPPPVDVSDPKWSDRVASTIAPCAELDHTQHGYDDTPDYDKFWIERDYLRDADTIKIPVLVSANWGDWNVKQVNSWRMFNALTNSEKAVLYMGDRWTGHGVPSVQEYQPFVHAWFAHYLKGENNGIQNSPSIISQGAEYNTEITKTLSSPSDFKTTDVPLTLMEMPLTSPEDYGWKMMPGKPQVNPMSSQASFPSANANTESHALHHARNDHDWFWFETPMLKNDTRIFGQPKVKLRIKTDRTWVTVTPTVVDVDMSCHQYIANQHISKPECAPRDLYSVTRGWLDSRYRNGLAKQQDLALAKGADLTVVEHPTDYTFKKGHVVGLMVSTEINEWSLPKPYPCQSVNCPTIIIDWQSGKSQLVLPIVHAPKDPMDLFDMGMHHH